MADPTPAPTGPMDGRTVVVTGANSGIGKATAEGLAAMGADVVITARDSARGTAARDEIRRASGSERVDLVTFDLGTMASVREGAAQLLERCPHLDVLVNNAGVILSDRSVTPDGFETQFAVNHLGPYLLTRLLAERLVASAPARVVTVSSTAHTTTGGGIDFDDLQSERRYRSMQVYGRTKLENLLFSAELARRLAGTGVTANALHPGVVATGYGRDGDTRGVMAFGLKLIKPFVLTPEQGARTSIYLASSPDVAEASGGYYVKCRPKVPSSAARDAEVAARLWAVSEELVAPVPPL